VDEVAYAAAVAAAEEEEDDADAVCVEAGV